MVKVAISGKPQFKAGELRWIQINGDDPGRGARQHRDRIVSGGRNGETGIAGLNVERVEKNIGVFPNLRITDPGKVSVMSGFAIHGKCVE